MARAENLRAAISARHIVTARKPLSVTISIGVALSTDFRHSDVDEMIHQADMALYAAKAAGRNCVRLAQPEPGTTEQVERKETVVGERAE